MQRSFRNDPGFIYRSFIKEFKEACTTKKPHHGEAFFVVAFHLNAFRV